VYAVETRSQKFSRPAGVAQSARVVLAAFPGQETCGLAVQKLRAAVSIPANIAERFRRRSERSQPPAHRLLRCHSDF
jgi:hypothetical protein